ncbi:MAG: ATP-binding protein, partial [Gemmatales bacterium]|nr:ATP-binding protein [Gemmatales bacterium]
LIALYHLFRHPQEAQDSELGREALRAAGVAEIPAARVVTFVGTAADPLRGRTPWGELAAQLGRYELLAEHDQQRRAPGKDRLHQVIGEAPTLILMDEIAEYAVKARDFLDQVVAFFQELTETVRVLERSALVATLPSSAPYGEEGERVLHQLQQIFGRMEAIYTPVDGEEIYEVIRRRLFEEIRPDEARRTADAYWEMYQRLGEDIPREAREPAYRDRLR